MSTWSGVKLLPTSKGGAPRVAHQLVQVWGTESKNEGRFLFTAGRWKSSLQGLEGSWGEDHLPPQPLHSVCVRVRQPTKSERALTLRWDFLQASLPVHSQVLPSMESVDGSDPLATLQNPMSRLEAKEEEEEDEDEDTEEDEEEDGEDTDLDDWEPDPPRPFDPHDLCEYKLMLVSEGFRWWAQCPCSVDLPSLQPHNSV